VKTVVTPALCFLLLAPGTARADLWLRTHTEVVRDQAAPAPSPEAARQIEAFLALTVPGGSLDAVEVISATAHRTQFLEPTPAVPRGGLLIQQANPPLTTVIDRRNGRYWSIPRYAPPFGTYGSVSYATTDDYETIAGARARRVIATVEALRTTGVTVSSATATLELWLTDDFPQYTHASHSGFAGAIDSAAAPAGFPMRIVMRNGPLSPYQIVTSVTEIREVPSDPREFAVPAGYTQVPPPPPDLAAAAAATGRDARPSGAARGAAAPRVIQLAKPKYTAEAMRQHIEGIARVSAIVEPDGTLQNVRIVRSLDDKYGLDRSAIACVKASTFEPGRRNGVAVPVMITIDVEFKIR
jgi:TonB family protein